MLLDFVVSEEAVRIWAEQGQMAPPVDMEVDDWQVSPLLAEALDLAAGARARPIWRRGSADFGFAIGPAAPEGFEAAMRDGFRAVMTGKRTPEQEASDLEVAWEVGRGE